MEQCQDEPVTPRSAVCCGWGNSYTPTFTQSTIGCHQLVNSTPHAYCARAHGVVGRCAFYFPALAHGPVRENNSGTFFLFCVCYVFCVFCVVARRSEFAPCTQKNAVVDDEIASWPRLIDTIIDAHFFNGKLLANTHASNRLID